ncbi:threonine/serine ThrE exporter family protein [Rhizobium daejeonense]
MAKDTETDTVSAEQTVHLVARVGRLLFLSGADTPHVAESVANVARGLGHTVHVLITPGAILATVGSNERFSTKVGPEFTTPAVDMGRLTAIRAVVDDILGGLRDPDIIDGRLDAIEALSGRYPSFIVVLGVALTTASLARLFGASWTVVAAAFIAGIASACLRRLLPRFGLNQFLATFVVAVLSGLAGVLALRLWSDASPVLVLTAAGMILVPGVPLINGIREISSGNAGNGVARLTTGTMTVLAIGFALYAVGSLTGATLPVDVGPGSLSVAQDLVYAGLAALGFAVLFNVPPSAIGFCIAAGMTSHGLRTGLEQLGAALPISSLLGALAAGLIARFAAGIHRVPAVVFAFPGVVAMIPGSYGFRAGIGGLLIMTQGSAASPSLVSLTAALAITTMVTTMAIAIGLTLSLSTRPDIHPASA